MQRRFHRLSSAIVAVVCCGPAVLVAAEPAWHMEPDRAWQTAADTGKPLLIFVTSPGCGYCAKMKRGPLADRDVIRKINADFVPLQIDSAERADLMRSWRIQAYPTILVVSPERKVLATQRGYLPTAKVHRLLDDATRSRRRLAQSDR